MVYGAYGYTGDLVVEEAIRNGLSPIIAGRNADRLRPISDRTGFEFRSFALDEPFDSMLNGVDAVLHCAGPFVRTSRSMVDACIRKGTHYLDVTGEIPVFESIMRRDSEAADAGVALIPGVGFDVVPTDCLAARLVHDLPDATHLDLAISTRRSRVSRGTMKTMIEGIGHGGAIRRNGRIEKVPLAWDIREIPFESGPRLAMTIPWGDVSTAYHTTGIPNIKVYSSASPRSVRRLKRIRPLLPLASLPPVRWLLLTIADRRTGPDETQRSQAWIDLWAEAWNADGKRVSKTMRVPDGYAFTAASATMAVQRVLDGVSPGAQTPSRAFGFDFLDHILEKMDRREPES